MLGERRDGRAPPNAASARAERVRVLALRLLLGSSRSRQVSKKAIGDPYETLDGWIAVELAVGVALFIACDVGFRRTLGITGGRVSLLARRPQLATIPLGLVVAASAQVGALAAIVAAALILEGNRVPPA